MNPLAQIDRQTSNAKFCEATGLPKDDADRMFRFEFSEAPLRPAIVCGTYEDKGFKIAVGHATYESPRARNAGHVLQLQIDYKERVNWEVEPSFSDVTTESVDRELSLYECLDGQGNPLHHALTRGSLPQGTTESSATTMVHQPPAARWDVVAGAKTQNQQVRTCYLCYTDSAKRIGANLCVNCWALFLKDVRCGECGNWLTAITFTSPLTALKKRGKDWYVTAKCGWCSEPNELICLPGTVANAIQKAIRGQMDDDGIVSQPSGAFAHKR
jgi:hypothetical protein